VASVVACVTTLDRPEVGQAELATHLQQGRAEARSRFAKAQQRIEEVSYRLALGGATICGHAIAPLLGAAIARRNDFVQNAKKEEVEAAFGAGDRVKVFAVARGSPASKAGLCVGDEVLAVDGHSITRTKEVWEALRHSTSGDPVFRVLRGGSEQTLSLPREMGCDSGFRVLPITDIDTWRASDRKDLWVPTGLIRFVQNDDELAIAIAHQIAHRLIGSFRRTEDEPRADRLGLTLAARAGFDIREAPAFWDRVAAEQPWQIPTETGRHHIAHGGLALRSPVIRATVAELAAQVKAGKPILWDSSLHP